MVILRHLVFCCVLGIAARASAQTPRLEQVRRAIDEVRYDRAQALLAEVLLAGGSSPRDLIEIYSLAASTAVVLGNLEEAERFYRQLLLVDPAATLGPEIAPKFKERFVAAQAFITRHGALKASVHRLGNDAIEIVLDSDPLAMVKSVAVVGDPTRFRSIGADQRATLPASVVEPAVSVALLDEFGNQLRVLVTAPVARTSGQGSSDSSPLRTWWVWTIPSGIAFALGVGAAIDARSAASDLDALLDLQSPFYGAAESLRKRYRARTTLANVAFGTAGAFAVVAGVVWMTRPRAHAPGLTVVPTVEASGAVGLALTGSL
jgi:hypothetical protein